MRRWLFCLSFVTTFIVLAPVAAKAEDNAPAAYAKWTAGKQSQPGLFTIWRDGSHVYIEASTAQLGKDYIEHAVPVSGLGGWDITPGNPYFDFARLIRFSRFDDKISITWPNTSFVAQSGTPAERAVAQTFASSVVGVAPIVAEDDVTGRIVFDAAPLLGDVSDFTDGINQSIGITDPQAQYHLDSDRTYFGPTKAFPENDVIEVDQTFASSAPPASVDNVPDPRSLQLKIDYNLIQAPADGYVPRIADERVGYYPNIQLQFGNDSVDGRQVRYIMRWNFAPADPGKPSAATNPMVWYISDTIPARYHDTVRNALLEWNKAYAKAGIFDAVQVRDQPEDPNWDPDDIRYNVIRWLTESNSGGFAQAGSVWDPRTGELIHVGVVLDSDLMTNNYVDWHDFADPARVDGAAMTEAAYGAGMRAQAGFGRVALAAMGALGTPAQQNAFDQGFLRSIVLHESGHEMGLQHNFIGSEAYTARDLQSKAFTSRYGVTNSVMEYAPLNLWPKGTGQGDYWQMTLGPYDYYVIHWGYSSIAGAHTPQDEVPTLKRWASTWSDPKRSFAMDEDVSYFDAHAIDPRVSHWDLTNDNLTWCDTQMKMASGLVNTIAARYPASGDAFDSARTAFGDLLGHYSTCALIAEHYIGGEYVNRSHVGDPGFSGVPLSSVSRTDERRAFDLMDRYLFSDAAWNYSPSLLRRLVYTEWVTDFPQPQWAYAPQPRHDMPIADIAGGLQRTALARMFQPLMLGRLDDLSMKYRSGDTMSLSDLFAWMQTSAFGDLRTRGLTTVPEIHRNLQQTYARMLATMVLHPADGTPYDAQSLARSELKSLGSDARGALASPRLDAVTRAHLEALSDLVTQTLEARPVISQSP
jgi:hypothetical protein